MIKNESPAPTKTEHLVFIENDKPITTSRLIAKTFGKKHQHVLRDIRDLECSEKFCLSNFGQSSYKNSQGKEQPEFHVTKDGFTMLAFGYTGDKAMNFKEAYIERFNFMDSELRSGKPETKQIPAQATYIENVVYPNKLGDGLIHCYYTGGKVYAKAGTLLSFLGYTSGFSSYLIPKIGEQNLIKVEIGKQLAWLISFDGLRNYLRYNDKFSFKKINAAARDIWDLDFSHNVNDSYDYHYTMMQMNEIYELVFDKPINKDKVIEKLRKGKIEGGHE